MLVGNILITGGTGTLGHAILRTAEQEGWQATFTIFSRSELRQAEMKRLYPDARFILGDIRDANRIEAAVIGHDCVIHAAAMKRIPECEAQPTECVETNVVGSANVIQACRRAGIRQCIGISTDKACGAVTTYGASKRMMEGLFQAVDTGRTSFNLVRYGNVLGSNGSVLQLWKEQVAQRKPLSITDYRMTRFWMGERAAVLAVERAYKYEGVGTGLIVVPKVPALSVAELAQMVAPGTELVETGLRSREKMHEELVHPFEAAMDQGTHFVLNNTARPSGISYTSENAVRLEYPQFLQLMREVEE